MNKLHEINHIIWDWNGTLLNDLDLGISIINKMLGKRGLKTITKDDYQEVFTFPVEDYYQRIGFNFELEPFEELSTEYITQYEEGRPFCNLFPEAQDVLQYFQEKGSQQMILSASKKAYLQKAVADYQIEGYFEVILGLDDHHAAGKLSLARSYFQDKELRPSCTLLIGDTIHDAEIADSLGIHCVLIPNGHHSHDRLKNTGHIMVDSLSALKDIL
jgi:phosphoglycolate phosphatase